MRDPATTLRLPALLLAAIVAAGCFGTDTLVEREEAPAVPALPPGCGFNQSALAHGPAGTPQPASGYGCLHTTTLDTYEPTIGVHPETGHIVLYPHYGDVGLGPMSMGRSEDDGATWTLHEPTVGGVNTHPISLDPFLYLDPATGRVFIDDLLTPECSALSFTDDLGDSWTHTATLCTEGDHVTIFAGPPAMSTTIGYPNVVYRCAINTFAVLYASFSSTCQKSLDGGLTWINTGAPAFVTDPSRPGVQAVPGWCDGGVGHGAVAHDGTVYLGKGLCGVPMAAVSHDEGLTWETHTISDLGMMVMFCQGWDHEVNLGVDPSGNAYAFWVDNQKVPRLAVSRDQGRSWGEAFDVRPPGVVQASMPQLAVGADGRVAMLYMGSTNAPEGPYQNEPETRPTECDVVIPEDESAYEGVTWNAYITVTTSALDDAPTFTTATANDPEDPLVTGKCGFRCPGFGDFLDIQIGPDGTPWAALVKPCSDCERTGSAPGGPAVVGRIYGGPDLWASDV